MAVRKCQAAHNIDNIILPHIHQPGDYPLASGSSLATALSCTTTKHNRRNLFGQQSIEKDPPSHGGKHGRNQTTALRTEVYLDQVTQAISYTPPPEWEPPAIEIKWENLPPLPLVQDPALLAQARRHKTHTLRAKFGADPDQPLHYSDAEIMAAELSCYKRLETLGDSVLQYHLLDFLENKYPHFTSSAFAVSWPWNRTCVSVG